VSALKVVISQPMLFPWVGMLEQIRLADVYVHYTDVQYSKGSLVNRVQIKTSTGVKWLTVPLVRVELGQKICEVRPQPDTDWKRRHLEFLTQCYAHAPFKSEMLSIVRRVYDAEYRTLGELSTASVMALCDYFGLTHGRRFVPIEDLCVDGASSERVLGIVSALGGRTYITGHGARNYLKHDLFESVGICVEYMSYRKLPYRQLHGEFTPFVSALDLVANEGRAGERYIQSTSVYWRDFLNE
jgi:WbqC-like protein family